MKFILLLLVLLETRNSAYPVVKTWTFHELAKAVERLPIQHPDNILVKAFDQMTTSVFKGQPNYVSSLLLSPSGNINWTRAELETALRNVHTYIYFTPFIGEAYVELNDYNTDVSHKMLDAIEVQIDALDISTWTKFDLKKALKDRSINPDLVPYLKQAENEAEEKGRNEDDIQKFYRKWGAEKEKTETKEKEKDYNVTIITPVGMIPPPPGALPLIVPRNKNDYKNYEENLCLL